MQTPRTILSGLGFVVVVLVGMGLTARLAWLGVRNIREASAISARLGPEIPDETAGSLSASRPGMRNTATGPTTQSADDPAAGSGMLARELAGAMQQRRQEQQMVMYDDVRRGSLLLALGVGLGVVWLLVAHKVWRKHAESPARRSRN
jgi:hypothetical protein